MASVVTEQEESPGDELPQDALDYFDGDELQARCFIEKYALETEEEGLVETHPKQMWERVAEAMASVEDDQGRWFDEFHWLLEDFKFVPGGRILYGAGNPRDVTLTNCYFTGIEEDSLEAIFDWCKSAARTYATGGGNGVDIGVLRPQGTPVNNAARTSSGAVSFMEVFSTTTGSIGQQGRRGALMISCPVDHPDIEDFVSKKSEDLDSVRFANISVKVDDAFMEAVRAGEDYELRFDNDDIDEPVRGTVDAEKLWDDMISSAHQSAEPGVLFWDTVKRESPSEYCAPVEGTNPCGEQPLESNGACTLGHVNLAAFVGGAFQDDAEVDWDGVERAVRAGIRFLDDVVEYNLGRHPHEEQEEQARNTRRVGLGVTGLGDMLAKLRIKYDTDEAIAFVDELMERIRNWAYDESAEIAAEKEPFPLFDAEEHLDRPFVQRLPEELRDKIAEHGLRNVCLLTVAPVGSGSVLTGTTSGVEPIFQLEYQRRSESLSQEFYEVEHRLVQEYREATGDEGELPDFFVTAHDIDPFFRVEMQGTLQQYVDSAISSTVNLPQDIDVETVKEVYQHAWERGCKGVTVYRETSREGILISEEEAEGEAETAVETEADPDPADADTSAVREAIAEDEPPQSAPRPRPDVVMGTTQKIETGYGSLYLTINEDESGLFEVFARIGRSGGYTASFTEAVARLISLGLRSGLPVDEIVEQLEGIRSPKIAWDHGEQIYSVPDAIATGLKRQLSGEFRKSIQSRVDTFADGPGTGANGDTTPVVTDTEEEKETVDPSEERDQTKELVSHGRSPECPDCSSMLVYEEGCVKCHQCGFSEC